MSGQGGTASSDGQRKGGSSRTAQVVRRPSSVRTRAAGVPAAVHRSSAYCTRSCPAGRIGTNPSLGAGERLHQSGASSASMGQSGGSNRAYSPGRAKRSAPVSPSKSRV